MRMHKESASDHSDADSFESFLYEPDYSRIA